MNFLSCKILVITSSIFLLTKLFKSFYSTNLARNETKETEKEKKFRKNDETAFLVALGSFASHSQIGKYTKEQEFENDKIVSKNPIQILSSTVHAVKGNEVEYHRNSSFFWRFLCGYISSFSNFNYGIHVHSNVEASNSIANHVIFPMKYSVGMKEDVDNVIEEFSRLPDKDIVLFGVSRGTASVVHSLQEIVKFEKFSNVKGIILEGCIDSFENLYYNRFKWTSKIIPFNIVSNLIFKATGYDQQENNPLSSLLSVKHERIPPILIISSLMDKEVPFECSKNFFETLQRHGFDVEFVQLEKSSHPRYMFDNLKDRELYFNKIHSFYKKIGVPHLD
jgi:glutaredoxin-related protein